MSRLQFIIASAFRSTEYRQHGTTQHNPGLLTPSQTPQKPTTNRHVITPQHSVLGFVNMTPDDSVKIMGGVTPSGG